jgi:hypothetical protein
VAQTDITSAYPNPFNPTISIEFALTATEPVELLVYKVVMLK